MIWLAMVVMMAGATPASGAQDLPATQDVTAIREQVASELWVYRDDRDKAPIHGFLTRLTRDELTLIDEDKQEHVIPIESIWKIERSGDSIWNGFAIGAAIGLVESILITDEVRGSALRKASFYTYAAGFFGLVGAGIDAMHVGRTTVYAVRRQRAGPAIAPSRDGRGAMVSWTLAF